MGWQLRQNNAAVSDDVSSDNRNLADETLVPLIVHTELHIVDALSYFVNMAYVEDLRPSSGT